MPEGAIENIDFTNTEQYTLSIRLSTDGFSFSVYNPLQEGESFLSEWSIETSLSLTANLKRVFQESELLKHAYKRVNLIITSKRFTTVPLELFEDEQAEAFFYHNHTPKENEVVLYNVLKKNNIVIIFGMDKSAHLFLTEQFPEGKFYSQTSPMTEYFSAKSKLGNSKKMYATVRQQSVDIYCFERGQLLLANSFDYKQSEDLIYYLLHIWQQLNFSQERDELHLTGTIRDKERFALALRRFLTHVFIIPQSTFTDIQTLISCEL